MCHSNQVENLKKAAFHDAKAYSFFSDFDSRLRSRSHTTSFGAQNLGETIYRYGLSGAIQSVSGNGNTAGYFYHPQKRTLQTVTYTKDGDTTPLLQSLRKHDLVNRLTRMTAHVNDAGVQKPVDHHAYEYDALDRIGSHADMTGAAWTYGYNATGEVTAATKKMPDGTTNLNGRDYRYHFDGIGNRTTVEQSRNGAQASRLFSYTPNALNQYSSVTHPDFVDISGTAASPATVTVNTQSVTPQGGYFYQEITEDNSSNPQWIDASITDGTTTTDGSLPLPAASTSPIYDDDGNLTSDSLWIYTWDASNRLIGCERSPAIVAAGAPYLREEHDYDYLGKRIRTSIFTSSGIGTPTSQTLYIFDGWKCVAELDALDSNQPVRKYTWGLDLAGDMGDSSTGNIGALLWLVDSATNQNHIHLYDKNGNVSGLVNSTTRKKSATYDYDAFGQLTTCYGDYAKSNPFTFSTKFTDFSTGLCYYGYRWYSPKDGRWPSRDPIGERGGINLYGFVKNRPISHVDRLGLKCCKKDIEDQLFELNRRYWGATQRFAANGVCPGGKGDKSCKNTSYAMLSALEPIPKCWTCSLERRRKPWYKGGYDHQVITCIAHPDPSESYNPDPVVFDFWGGNDVSAPHDDFVDDYPVPLVPEDPRTGTSENDHTPEENQIIRDHPYDVIDSITPSPGVINLP